jgi:D-glycero-alpha-D-manno-heptose-7-phosphate kinase
MDDAPSISQVLKTKKIHTSAPCRLDMGGTLDLATFYVPLFGRLPSTFNLGLDLRTHVRIKAFKEGRVQVSSEGLGEESYPAGQAPYDGVLGMFFVAADAMGLSGISIDIQSQSPPKSALGGSSVALVAVLAALNRLVAALGRAPLGRAELVQTAFAIESGASGVVCGMQDHLAAAYGGVNQWVWRLGPGQRFVRRVIAPKRLHKALENSTLLVYPGVTHQSTTINRRWVEGFQKGRHRQAWAQICVLTDRFCRAVAEERFDDAGRIMNEEVDLRLDMTPEVLTENARQLVDLARAAGCGARFTGSGGGGCLWALGGAENIAALKKNWQARVKDIEGGLLLPTTIAAQGIVGH